MELSYYPRSIPRFQPGCPTIESNPWDPTFGLCGFVQPWLASKTDLFKTVLCSSLLPYFGLTRARLRAIRTQKSAFTGECCNLLTLKSLNFVRERFNIFLTAIHILIESVIFLTFGNCDFLIHVKFTQ